MKIDQDIYFALLKNSMELYSVISDETLQNLQTICTIQTYKMGEIILDFNDIAKDMYYICTGLLRTYFLDANGQMYNKNLFLEGDFSGSKASMLMEKPSEFCIEALEDTTVIIIPYKAYRKLIDQHTDLKDFYIAYIEQKWIIEKEQHEIALVLEDATQRYLTFLQKYPIIEKRVAQHHIAAHLGITPTQLSRIRKNLKN